LTKHRKSLELNWVLNFGSIVKGGQMVVLRKIVNCTLSFVAFTFCLFILPCVMPVSVAFIYIGFNLAELLPDWVTVLLFLATVAITIVVVYRGVNLCRHKLSVCPECGHFARITNVIARTPDWSFESQQEEPRSPIIEYHCGSCDHMWLSDEPDIA